MVLPSGEKATENIQSLCALCFCALSSRVPAEQPREGVSSACMAVRIALNGSPASQTLIVRSSEPDTIVLPSGEKATDLIQSLWAFSFVALSSRVPEKHAERASDAREWQLEKAETAHPRPTL